MKKGGFHGIEFLSICVTLVAKLGARRSVHGVDQRPWGACNHVSGIWCLLGSFTFAWMQHPSQLHLPCPGGRQTWLSF